MVRWNDSYRIGISKIDSQHKQLFAAIDSLLDQTATGHGTAELYKTVEFIHQYTREHFADEEHLMLEHKYPGYLQQKKQHRSFVRQIMDIGASISSQKASLKEVASYQKALLDWLSIHVKSSDMKLGQYLKEQPENSS